MAVSYTHLDVYKRQEEMEDEHLTSKMDDNVGIVRTASTVRLLTDIENDQQ